MSTDQNAPRDIVEGGPERAPDGQDDPKRAPEREDAPGGKRKAEKKDQPPGEGDVPPWYHSKNGQPGSSK